MKITIQDTSDMSHCPVIILKLKIRVKICIHEAGQILGHEHNIHRHCTRNFMYYNRTAKRVS